MGLSMLGVMAAAVVFGGPGYAEAEKRALAYDANDAGTVYDKQAMYPVIARSGMLRTCENRLRIKLNKATPGFRAVVSFKGGKFDTVFVDKESDLSRCVAGVLAGLALPDAPVADYAERMTFVFED